MNKQILEVVDSVSMEKGVDKSIIFEALEEAITSATKKLLGDKSEVEVTINRSTGEYDTYRYWLLAPSDDEENEMELIPEDLSDYESVDGLAKKKIENIDFGKLNKKNIKVINWRKIIK